MLLEPGVEPADRGDVDDAAAAVAGQRRGERPAEQERPPQVRLLDAVPGLGVELVELAERDADVPRRVVDQDVAAAEVLDHGGGGGVDGGLVALVELHQRAARRPWAPTAAAVRSAPSVLPT